MRIASGLSSPVNLIAPPNDPRLFIVTQGGNILIIEDGQVLPTPFLDLIPATTSEGLQGLAFPPDYSTSGLFYVKYMSGPQTVIARYPVSTDPNIADRTMEERILLIDQPFSNHNGGHLAFGPDGFLYIAMGDGGDQNDPDNRAQDDSLMLGKMLRIDVSGGLGSGYSIPPDNPFVGPGDPLDEIWAKGFRNPFRWSFDRLTGDIYIADVGQNTWEEVDVEPAASGGGLNYGWRLMEGPVCFNPPSNCNDGTLTLPVHSYNHDAGRCAIIGGYVYRGSFAPIQGHYFFGDTCTGEIWSIVWDGAGGITDFTDRTAELAPDVGTIDQVVGFGQDRFGELYIVDLDGELFKIVGRLLRFFRATTPIPAVDRPNKWAEIEQQGLH